MALSEKHKLATVKPLPTINRKIDIKSPIGSDAREFAGQHGGKTQGQMALLWGEGVSQQNISDALRKLGLSRKSGKSAV